MIGFHWGVEETGDESFPVETGDGWCKTLNTPVKAYHQSLL